ncbi:MAG: FkbM family methyltransferase [Kiritimatiellae bacterium]|nr:FkbM family methyltransferase [Kiritimatiellia bacterium]MDD5523056.1 FkbM family methyltransferase [Kiritimatiellia bacterium]
MKRVFNRIRRVLAPSRHERAVRRYFADGGDYRFRFSYDLGPDALVLDLGGYQGQWASDIFARYLCRIEVFEPVPEFAEKIRERFRRNGKIRVHEFALGGSSRKDVIKINADGSSLFASADKTATVEVVDISEWLEKEGVRKVDLMKINVEGAEYELIERLIETRMIRIVNHLQVQFHDVVPDAETRMKTILAALEKTHYPTYQFKFVWENWTRKPGITGLGRNVDDADSQA